MKDPPIRAIYISANNPAVTCPEVHKVRRVLRARICSPWCTIPS